MDKPEIMTLEEVAEYLRISERTVYDWAQKGDIPCGKLGTAWRFKRADIEAWVDRQMAGENKNSSADRFGLHAVMSPQNIIVTDKRTKKEVLVELIELMSSTKIVKSKLDLTEGIFFREELMSTGIGNGIAIPHVRLSSIKDVAVGVAVAPLGIEDYEAMDNIDVQLLFMILARKDQHVEHLKVLSGINTQLKDDELKKRIIETRDPQKIFELLTS